MQCFCCHSNTGKLQTWLAYCLAASKLDTLLEQQQHQQMNQVGAETALTEYIIYDLIAVSLEGAVWKQWDRMYPRASHLHLIGTQKLKLREQNVKVLS